MSGMDRLTDEQLDGLLQEGDAAPWVSEMARELLAHRRASQAALAPSDALRETLEAIRDGYGPNHLSKYARDTASAALAASPAQEGGGRVMDCVIVSSEDELKKIVAEKEAQGLRLAAASNAGLPLGKARLTFLPESAFKSEERH